MTTREYTEYLNDLLSVPEHRDVSLNGVQIGAEERVLKKVAFAVDACQETIDRAVEEGADVLVVHHGLFWGKPLALVGSHLKRVKSALDGGLTLYACHIPLDCHTTLGHNAQMAELLGLKEKEGFGEWMGNTVGCKGRLEEPLTLGEIKERLSFSPEAVFINGSGKERFRSVAIISGSGKDDLYGAIESGVDLYITGEIAHENYHAAMEAGLSVLAGGHYRTETFGLKALQRLTEEQFRVETIFLDAETGL